MTVRRGVLAMALALLLLPLLPTDGHAIPAFARKYRVSCLVCHSAVPRLNAFGEQFAANGFEFAPGERKSGKDQVTMDGNLALTYGLLAAGVRYGAGYPITPWSTVMETLRSELPKYGGIFVQAEDELARHCLFPVRLP